MTNLRDPTSRPSFVVMVGNKRKQEHQHDAQRRKVCRTRDFHIAKVRKALCNQVAKPINVVKMLEL